jgi:hypothetical protein
MADYDKRDAPCRKVHTHDCRLAQCVVRAVMEDEAKAKMPRVRTAKR